MRRGLGKDSNGATQRKRKRGDTGRHHPYLSVQADTTTRTKGPPNPFDHAFLPVQTTLRQSILLRRYNFYCLASS